MASMAHPIFSLSTKPDHRIRRYEDETGKNFVEVKPSAEGLATIHDRDVLIYCISQLIAAINDGQTPSKTLRMKAYDFLKATNRVTDGRGYDALRSALIRLQGTQIETNIVTGETEQLDIFSIIDRAKIVRQTRDGRMQEIEVQLSDWVSTLSEQRRSLPSIAIISGCGSR
jgi:plasmid replication initiation protein